MSSSPRARAGRVATATLVSMLAVGCSAQKSPADADGEPTAPPTSATAQATKYPLTIDNCGREVTFDKAPSRVVLLNGTSVAEVESFVTLGIQDRILANSQSYGVSDEPGMVEKVAAVPTNGLSLNENFEVPREQVLALKPDLVISTWAGGFDEKIGSISRDQLDQAGIDSFVTPVNCAYGAPDARQEDQEKYDHQSVESSFDLLLALGEIFDVQKKAADYVNEARTTLADISSEVKGAEPKSVLVAYPGMAMMNNNGLPAVFGGGIYDDIIDRAGGVNAFAGKDTTELAEINAEALASAKVDVLVIGLFQPNEDGKLLAEDLFRKFPGWAASKTKTYTTVSDGFYLGPFNTVAVRKIADAAHAKS
ncbi:ABC transporter substrate-binding protein [Actinophytocola oryzae]|uniref:Iron complex transport system substrate-binding protein n=1 Tax=Actinophytocola oryzae TaxID=502181 RepID=A0A4R7V4J0_9PSEU|nr:ABC transporter substrate-binding protein [Actinophytocola oryzae]TDV44259.1 iron complex transport system substrate-binding protein [Actinophytocola oryzae]